MRNTDIVRLNSEDIEFTFRKASEQQPIKEIIYALQSIDYYTTVESLLSSCTDGLLHLTSFLSWSKSLGLSEDHMPILVTFFQQFDVMRNMTADSSELTCGLLCFFQGSKSQKLSIAFSLFDENGDGLISRRTVWKIFRSFLRGITLFCDFNGSVDEISVISTAKIFKYFSIPKHIRLEDLSDWYLFCGNDISFWIELLDCRKWNG